MSCYLDFICTVQKYYIYTLSGFTPRQHSGSSGVHVWWKSVFIFTIILHKCSGGFNIHLKSNTDQTEVSEVFPDSKTLRFPWFVRRSEALSLCPGSSDSRFVKMCDRGCFTAVDACRVILQRLRSKGNSDGVKLSFWTSIHTSTDSSSLHLWTPTGSALNILQVTSM